MQHAARLVGPTGLPPEERAPVPYLQWPHRAVLDLVVQQALSPSDPGLAAMQSSGTADEGRRWRRGPVISRPMLEESDVEEVILRRVQGTTGRKTGVTQLHAP